jgi:negative regulator of sigma E activity
VKCKIHLVMNEEQQLKLQAFLDGELPEAEARAMVSLIARDEEAKALHAELKNTRSAVKSSKPNVQLPESREFFWSKIERDIQRLQPTKSAVPKVAWWEHLRRLLMPMGAMAALFLVGMFTYNQLGLRGRSHSIETDLAMADTDGFTYRDYSAGMTLVWLPFPAENDLAQDGAPTTIQ